MTKKYPRRSFLRGTAAGGISTLVALPLLEASFRSDRAFAQAAGGTPRLIAFYVPNGTIEERWFPDGGSGNNYDLSGTALAPLAPFQDSLRLFRRLGNTGRSGSGNAHMRAIAGFLTGTAISSDAVSRVGISLDQRLADHYATTSPTPVHSLQLAGNNELDPPNNNRYNNQLKNSLSFDREGRILPNTSDLRSVFNRLFTGVDDGQVDEAARRRAVLGKSVLDHVLQDSAQLSAGLGTQDRQRVEEYFDSLRALERRLQPPAGAAACDVGGTTFPSYDDDRRLDEIGDHARQTARMLSLAFRCDATRVATYMAGGEAAGCRYNDIGVGEHFHNNISHNRGGKADLHHRIDTYHSELVAAFLQELADTPHGDGTLYDSTAVIYGAGLGNGDRHSLADISLAVAGRFGASRGGIYHRDLGGRDHGVVLYSIARELGLGDGPQGDHNSGDTVDLG